MTNSKMGEMTVKRRRNALSNSRRWLRVYMIRLIGSDQRWPGVEVAGPYPFEQLCPQSTKQVKHVNFRANRSLLFTVQFRVVYIPLGIHINYRAL